MGGDEDGGPLVAIVGPTAVGKTALAVRLCLELGGEVISADSRQIYRRMDIGTAKASAEERRQVPHHLIDVVSPDEPFTLAQYQSLAYRAIRDVLARGCVPFLVGGTGLYVRAVLEGLRIPRVPPNPTLRADLLARAEREGAAALHAWLAQVDPQAARAMDARNTRRVIRALEVYLLTGEPISAQQRASPPPYRTLRLGLTMPRPLLYQRIDERVERMVQQGLVDEVRALLEMGYSADLPSMSGVGYRQMVGYLRGETDLAEAVRRIKRDTRRFVRQQYNWFRLDDPHIRWFDVGGGLDEAYPAIREAVARFVAQGGLSADG
jgi:tRNA dimethylallyltransferase